jgi:iron uptake system component EfeO
MARLRLPALVTAGMVVFGAAACGLGETPPPTGTGGPIAVTATESECAVARTETAAGATVFKVTNGGTKVTEFYVYAQGDRVMGEVENIGPGLSRDLHVELAAGTYRTACKPGMSGSGIRARSG